MTDEFETRRIDIAAVELQARRMRAEAFATGMRNARGWVRSTLTRRTNGRPV